MDSRNNIIANLDWISILLWLVMMAYGWMNIYSANIMEAEGGVFDFSQRYGKQLIWIGASFLIAVVIMVLDAKFYIHFAYILYAILVVVLAGVLVFGKEINGARSWFVIGGFQLQPSEFAKPITALALANMLTSHNFNIRSLKHLFRAGAIMVVPPLLILLQPDLGSVLVYTAFIFVLYREGFSGNIMMMLLALMILFLATLILDKSIVLLTVVMAALLIFAYVGRSVRNAFLCLLGFGLSFGAVYGLNQLFETGLSLFTTGLIAVIPLSLYLVFRGLKDRTYPALKVLAGAMIALLFMITINYAMNNVLKPHQQHRIYVTLGLEDDPQGVGYNVNQSKIAIGSGGFSGKGFLDGTQTKLHFVPEQSTDFIFCTVGEEWGFLGTTFVILLYTGFLLRMIVLAERQRSSFSRVFGYGFISIVFVHFLINIGMTIGLLPVIGIPLPFFSYGGSSLWAFTMFFFIFLRLDASRLELLR